MRVILTQSKYLPILSAHLLALAITALVFASSGSAQSRLPEDLILGGASVKLAECQRLCDQAAEPHRRNCFDIQLASTGDASESFRELYKCLSAVHSAETNCIRDCFSGTERRPAFP